MPAYNFQYRFARKVESGAKTHTIRAPRKDGNGPKPGQLFAAYEGMRTKKCRCLLRGEITKVQSVSIQPDGVIRLDDERLSVEKADALAVDDGFTSVTEFFRVLQEHLRAAVPRRPDPLQEDRMSEKPERATPVRRFPLGDILSITTGVLLCPIGKVYEILNYMTGDNLFTHQLPRVSRECEPYLLKQHPQLAEIDASGVNGDNWQEFLQAQVAKYGAELPVAKLPPGEHYEIDPISELAEKVHPDKIITVTK